MQVVRTIGRAFDVCHQLLQQQQQPGEPSVGEVKSSDEELDAAEKEDSQPDTTQPQGKGRPSSLFHTLTTR